MTERRGPWRSTLRADLDTRSFQPWINMNDGITGETDYYRTGRWANQGATRKQTPPYEEGTEGR